MMVAKTFMEARDKYISHSLIDEKDADELFLGLHQCVQDEQYVISFPRTTQIYGRFYS